VGSGERAFSTPAKQVDGHLDAVTTYFYGRLAGHINEMLCQTHASVEITLSGAISQDG